MRRVVGAPRRDGSHRPHRPILSWGEDTPTPRSQVRDAREVMTFVGDRVRMASSGARARGHGTVVELLEIRKVRVQFETGDPVELDPAEIEHLP